ncbi:MAG: hypothetical protein M1827_006789 [Pycnora praestabilis]|nr:MAG: hypothetical protein M1827_006789 [Pycnora praestabilis]
MAQPSPSKSPTSPKSPKVVDIDSQENIDAFLSQMWSKNLHAFTNSKPSSFIKRDVSPKGTVPGLAITYAKDSSIDGVLKSSTSSEAAGENKPASLTSSQPPSRQIREESNPSLKSLTPEAYVSVQQPRSTEIPGAAQVISAGETEDPVPRQQQVTYHYLGTARQQQEEQEETERQQRGRLMMQTLARRYPSETRKNEAKAQASEPQALFDGVTPDVKEAITSKSSHSAVPTQSHTPLVSGLRAPPSTPNESPGQAPPGPNVPNNLKNWGPAAFTTGSTCGRSSSIFKEEMKLSDIREIPTNAPKSYEPAELLKMAPKPPAVSAASVAQPGPVPTLIVNDSLLASVDSFAEQIAKDPADKHWDRGIDRSLRFRPETAIIDHTFPSSFSKPESPTVSIAQSTKENENCLVTSSTTLVTGIQQSIHAPGGVPTAARIPRPIRSGTPWVNDETQAMRDASRAAIITATPESISAAKNSREREVVDTEALLFKAWPKVQSRDTPGMYAMEGSDLSLSDVVVLPADTVIWSPRPLYLVSTMAMASHRSATGAKYVPPGKRQSASAQSLSINIPTSPAVADVQVEEEEPFPARIRKVILINLPPNSTAQTVQSLVFYGGVEAINYTPSNSSAIVHFLDPAECMKYYKATSNGLVVIMGTNPIREHVIFVELSREVDPVGGLLKAMIENGATRCVRAVGVGEDLDIATLAKLAAAKGRKVEFMESGKNVTGSRTVTFRFCKIQDAVHFKGVLHRDEEWEHCNINFSPDPCAAATGVHWDKYGGVGPG